jgi:hypothetical protein
MAATRARFESLVEWAAAVAVIAVLLGAGSVAVREFRGVDPATPVSAREPFASPVPAAVPARAVSVPVLLLRDGAQVRVGDTLAAVVSRLQGPREEAPKTVDRVPTGERLILFYEYGGARFTLVLEPTEPADDARVSAIYLH